MLSIVLALVVLIGCAASGPAWDESDIVRPAVGAPERFRVPMESGSMEIEPGGYCRSPLVDPRDGTRLGLVRSVPEWGDYEVPAAKYGISDPKHELLRVDCDGRPVGIVRM